MAYKRLLSCWCHLATAFQPKDTWYEFNRTQQVWNAMVGITRSKVLFPRSSFIFSCSSFIFCVFPCGEKHGEPCFSMCSTLISTAFVFAVSLSATIGARFDSFGLEKLYLLETKNPLCLKALAIFISQSTIVKPVFCKWIVRQLGYHQPFSSHEMPIWSPRWPGC